MNDSFGKLIQKADQFDSIGDYDNAISIYDKLIQSGYLDAKVYALRGYSKFRARYFKDAIDDFSKAIALKNNVPTTFYYRARAKEEIGDLQGALQDYKNSAELDFDKPDVHINMGMIYEYLGDFKKAEYEYKIALKIDPKNSIAINSLNEISKRTALEQHQCQTATVSDLQCGPGKVV